jgi:hypothetical protein
MSIDELVGGPDHEVEPVVLRARIVVPPTDVSSGMTVIIPGYSDEHDYEIAPGQWTPRSGSVMPTRGTWCLVTIDSDGDAWVPVIEGTSDFGVMRVLNNTWRWTTTASASARQIRLDTSVWSTATEIWVSETQTDGNDMTLALAQVRTGDEVLLQQADNAASWARYTVTVTPTDQGTWWKLPVTMIDGGTAAIPTNNADTRVLIERSGAGGGAGGEADKNYVHTQGAAAASWVIVHGLSKYPAVVVVDTGGSVVIPDVHYDSVDQVTLTFGSATSGKAYVN